MNQNRRKSALGGLLLAWLAAASIGMAAADLSAVNVFPNPARAYIGQTQVTFANLTEQVQVKIFNAAGGLVREASLGASGGQFLWLLDNNSGDPVASGIYVYLITNDSGEELRGKVAVIR